MTACLGFTMTYAVDGPATTYGNLSVGKFYTYQLAPHASYPDRWPNQWCSGAKLTDENLGQGWPLDDWVDWLEQEDYTLEIVLDLGSVCEVDKLRVMLTSRLDWGIQFPSAVRFYYKTDLSDSWQQYGISQSCGGDTAGYSAKWVTVQDNFESMRYIKYELDGPVEAHMFVGEIEAWGNIENSWKAVPDWGCYQGAFPSNSTGSMFISTYEGVADKQMSMALWYANMGASDFKDYFGSLWRSQYGLSYNIDYQGARFLEVGWEPETNITAENIASGYYDSYFNTFFEESVDYSHRLGNTDPVWLRPMSEMNGGWTFPGNAAAWGGHPQEFRWAWRRMFNIAQQVGAADHHIFIWSPNGYTYSGEEHMPNHYYPGDQYVDWVGISVYEQGEIPYPEDTLNGTCGVGGFDFYGTYSYKPIIFSEGAFRGGDGIDGYKWIRQWFEIPRKYPMVKALVWFYIHDDDKNVIDEEPFRSYYRSFLSDSYFLTQSIAGTIDNNGDGNVDILDYSHIADNWSLGVSNLQGDIDGNNDVNIEDVLIFASEWLQ